MRELDDGETLIVHPQRIPVADITPAPRASLRPAAAAVALFRSAPHVDYARLRADHDALADQAIEPRALPATPRRALTAAGVAKDSKNRCD